MAGTTTIYGISYPVLADAPPDITEVGSLASDLDVLVAKIDAGEAVKQRVAAVATSNVNIASLPATIDDVTMAAADLFLLTGQSTASQNGLWTYTSAAGAATRPYGFNSGAVGAGRVAGGHLVIGGIGGTSNGGAWQCTNTGAITVDTTGLVYRKVLGAGSIITTDLADLAVTAAKIASATITSAEIAASLKPSGSANDADESLRALGTGAGTAAAGNDSRLSDARSPTSHASSHLPNASDAISFSGSINMSGVIAARPSASASNAGCWYYATDVDALYRSDGSNWTRVGVQAGMISPIQGFTAQNGTALLDGSAVSRTGVYADLYAATILAQSGTRNGTTVITGLTTTLGMSAGQKVEGTGIPSNTTIASVDSTTQITMSASATSSGTSTVTVFPHGNGNGSTTFNLLDMRGYAVQGMDKMGGSQAGVLANGTYLADRNGIGRSGGEQNHTLAGNESGIAAHGHSASQSAHSHSTTVSWNNGTDNTHTGSGNFVTGLVGSGGSQNTAYGSNSQQPAVTVNNAADTAAANSHNNLPPVRVLNWVVKL